MICPQISIITLEETVDEAGSLLKLEILSETVNVQSLQCFILIGSVEFRRAEQVLQ